MLINKTNVQEQQLIKLGEPLAEQLDDVALAWRLLARQGSDDGDDALAEIGVRHADHGRLVDAGQAVELFLDLLGIDVEPTGDDQVLAVRSPRWRAGACGIASCRTPGWLEAACRRSARP